MPNERRYTVWEDQTGKQVLTALQGNATLSGVLTALEAKSVGAVLYNTESADLSPTRSSTAGAYNDVMEVCTLLFYDASGYIVKVLLPMPAASIFLSDNVTVDESQITAIKSAVIGTVLSAGGLPAVGYRAGYRSSAGIAPAGIPPAGVTPNTLGIDLSGALIGTEPALNFIPSTGMTIGVVDNPGSNRVDVTLASSSATAGQLVNIYDNLLAATAANFDITSISNAYTQLWLFLYLRTTSGNTEDVVQATFNGAATAFDWVEVFSSTTAAGGQGAANTTFMRIGVAPGGGATANWFSSGDYRLPNYKATTGTKSLNGSHIRVTQPFTQHFSGHWRNTAAVSRITITPAAGNWAIGSRATLYGLS